MKGGSFCCGGLLVLGTLISFFGPLSDGLASSALCGGWWLLVAETGSWGHWLWKLRDSWASACSLVGRITVQKLFSGCCLPTGGWSQVLGLVPAYQWAELDCGVWLQDPGITELVLDHWWKQWWLTQLSMGPRVSSSLCWSPNRQGQGPVGSRTSFGLLMGRLGLHDAGSWLAWVWCLLCGEWGWSRG